MLQNNQSKRISDIAEEYLTWLQVERRFAKSSIVSYRSRLKCFIRDLGDKPVEQYEVQEFVHLKNR